QGFRDQRGEEFHSDLRWRRVNRLRPGQRERGPEYRESIKEQSLVVRECFVTPFQCRAQRALSRRRRSASRRKRSELVAYKRGHPFHAERSHVGRGQFDR